MNARPWQAALEESGALARLAAFDPRVAGTFPLGLDVAGSDIDILCHAADAQAFAGVVWQAFAHLEGFSMHQWTCGERAVVAVFRVAGLPFEVFGSPLPVDVQAGWRHFLAEQQLLETGGGAFFEAVRAARRTGLKTEPAFAHVLGMKGDPYEALLALAPPLS